MVTGLAGSGDVGKAVVNAGIHAVDATPIGWATNLAAPNTVQSIREMTKPQDEGLASAANTIGTGAGLTAGYAMGKAGNDALSERMKLPERQFLANHAVKNGYVSEDPRVNAAIQKYATKPASNSGISDAVTKSIKSSNDNTVVNSPYSSPMNPGGFDSFGF